MNNAHGIACLILAVYYTCVVKVEKRELSHPVHSDNCILNEATGECDKVPPAYTWRNYRSAHLSQRNIYHVSLTAVLNSVQYLDCSLFSLVHSLVQCYSVPE